MSYSIILVSNLELIHRELLEAANFRPINDELWLLEGSEVCINSQVREVFNSRMSEKQKDLWKDLISLRCNIDEEVKRKSGQPLFNTTYEQLRLILHWNGRLTWDQSGFKDFINCMNILFRDNLCKGIKEYFSKN